MSYQLGGPVPNPMDRPIKEDPEPEYNLFADPDYLFEVAAELAREQGRMIFNEEDPRRER